MRIAVIGLGYVGLPLAVALARHFDTIGFDVDGGRVAELADGHDRTGEIEADTLSGSSLTYTSNAAEIAGTDVYVVTVPTPVDDRNKPDLSALEAASHTVAKAIDPEKRPTVIYESTVYPGVTEDICGAILEGEGLQRGRDFRLGYSPERINPGDKVHTVDKIMKVIAGEDDEVAAQLEKIYGKVTSGGTFRAASIRAAEAAKAIENAQRDINVAFMNEVAKLMADVGVSAWDVLDAARTKWNFLPFEPGLVGGHCIGVDPYYLSHLAGELGHDPRVILAGRGTNDGMGGWIADRLHEKRGGKAGKVLVMGLTFKENVPDLRNSRSIDLFGRFRELGHEVAIADVEADPDEVEAIYGQRPIDPASATWDLVVAAVKHDGYSGMARDGIASLVADGGTLADIKGMWRRHSLEKSVDYWTL